MATAAELYDAKRCEVLELLDAIRDRVLEGDAHVNWGHVGSMGAAVDSLRNAAHHAGVQ